jgi:hypothetical protein
MSQHDLLTRAFFVASYLALPFVTSKFALAVLSGTGTRTVMLIPQIFELKAAFTCKRRFNNAPPLTVISGHEIGV